MKPDIHRRFVTRCSCGRRPQDDAKAVDEPARRERLGAGDGSLAALRACTGTALGTRECMAPPHAESTRHTAGQAMAIDPGLITRRRCYDPHADR
jgi:hypothetical protein